MTEPEISANTKTVFAVVRDPRWWIEEVLAALIIGAVVAAGSIMGQKSVDDRRAQRELDTALASNRHDLQLENLRFVRDRSANGPQSGRRFAEFDLAGQNLVGLQLAGADFARADLTGAKLAQTDLSRSNLARADLRDANLSGADLRGAYLGPERIRDAADQAGADLSGSDLTDANLSLADLSRADLSRADLSRADLSQADLSGARLTDVYYDGRTVWPQGFVPPPSRPVR